MAAEQIQIVVNDASTQEERQIYSLLASLGIKFTLHGPIVARFLMKSYCAVKNPSWVVQFHDRPSFREQFDLTQRIAKGIGSPSEDGGPNYLPVATGQWETVFSLYPKDYNKYPTIYLIWEDYIPVCSLEQGQIQNLILTHQLTRQQRKEIISTHQAKILKHENLPPFLQMIRAYYLIQWSSYSWQNVDSLSDVAIPSVPPVPPAIAEPEDLSFQDRITSVLIGKLAACATPQDSLRLLRMIQPWMNPHIQAYLEDSLEELVKWNNSLDALELLLPAIREIKP